MGSLGASELHWRSRVNVVETHTEQPQLQPSDVVFGDIVKLDVKCQAYVNLDLRVFLCPWKAV